MRDLSTGNLASSTTVQRAPGLEDTNTEENTVFSDYGVSERGIEGRAGVVDIEMLNRWNGRPILMNSITDGESRTLQSSAEWMLERSICHIVIPWGHAQWISLPLASTTN